MNADYSSLLFMIILIVLGFILKKTRLLKINNINAIPLILLNVAYPALIIDSVISVDINSLAKEGILVVSVTFAITLSLFFFGILILRKYKNEKRKPLILFSMAIGNIAFVALPVIRAIFGDVGVYYTMLHNSVHDIMIWTLYYAYFVGGGKLKNITFKKFITPSFLALAIAILIAVFKIKLNIIAVDLIQALSGLAVPLALIYIGGVLADHSRVRDWIPDKDTVLISVAKVFIIPVMVFGIMQFIPVDHNLKILMAVVFSAPVPIMSTIWAKLYGYDYAFSIRSLMLSTVLFLIGSASLFIFIKTGIV